ncbi:GntR family transcriptional regulator [Halomonas sp. MES3-P3E]|uniref:GntR family transcriptional regulator n=1 Tax=Halomonas sp. MES3-P3E TaxID=2058321 RepID=UPI000C3412AC|nr:GntR family transcriptional regulator [Halomonas sp. MES3-P3E]PKG54218.1 GntR family transcriptional regulator [Halomonas sp. MES3-P3E]
MPTSHLKTLYDEFYKGLGLTIPPSRRSEAVAHVIRRAILAGDLKPGNPIRERNLAAELKISRTPVREALFILQGEGLISLSHNRGAYVSSFTVSDIEQIYALRRVLEAHAAHCAAIHRNRTQLDAIAETLETQKRLDSNATPMEQAQADLAFHEAIAAAAGSQMLLTIAHQVLAVTVTLRSHHAYSTSYAKQMYRRHRAIFEAIEAGNAEAAEALMAEHVAQACELALERIGTEHTLGC